MNFNEIKNELKEGYLAKGLEFVDENEDQVRLKHDDEVFTITKEDIEDYLEFTTKKSEFERVPCDASMCSKEYREQPVYDSRNINTLRFYTKDGDIVFGKESSSDVYVKIGRASKDFLNFFRFNFELEFYQPWKKIKIVKSDGSEEVINDIRNISPRLFTIKVYNLSEKSISDAEKKSDIIIRNCIFELSYLKGIPLLLRVNWDSKRWKKVFRPFELERTNTFSLSKVNFNPDLIRFYQFGMSSRIPETKFLAYYQVLEYFFIPISNELVYEKLSNRIKDPQFKHTNTNLDKLVQVVLKHRQENNETVMLKNVLNKFVAETDLIDFIKKYEKFLENNAYSKSHTIFGEKIMVQLEPNHVIGNVATRIKCIRNALVHSTDKYERKVRHVPFTKTTEIIKQDIPLIKFLAERVIVASAK